MKYQPKNTIELEVLLSDESIYLGDIDTSLITDMSCLFANDIGAKCPNRKDFSGISNWDVSNVENMSSMFENCPHFNEDISSWDTSSVRDMSRMFVRAKSFNQPLNSWDVSSVENMMDMFIDCVSFNQPLDKWDTGSVENMICMFAGAKSFNQPLNSWDIGNVDKIYAMFRGCDSLDQSFDAWASDDDRADFIICELAKFLGINAFREHFNKIKPRAGKYKPKRKWQLSLLILDENVKLGDIDTSLITDMSELFAWTKRKDFSGISSWNVSNVEDMSSMLCLCNDCNEPIGCWDIRKVEKMDRMFEYCRSFNQPLDRWDAKRLKTAIDMFNGCKAITFQSNVAKAQNSDI